ncbi:MAG: hypothetical protein PWP76_137 [Candidatus Diapherotrites archaeon]|nr:hypothetical protein [Candidatus Diapherotrites archaeon]
MQSRDALLLAEFIIFLSLLLSAYYYAALPSKIVTHWGINREPNGWMNRNAILWFPVAYAVLVFIVWGLPFIDPLRRNVEKFRKVYDWFVVGLAVFLAVVQVFVLGYNLGWFSDVTIPILILVSVLMIGAGYIMYVSEPNWFVGFRTPWTLSSPEVWKRVNRAAGILFAAFGVAMLITAFISAKFFMYLILALLAAIVVLWIWSYVLYQKLH